MDITYYRLMAAYPDVRLPLTGNNTTNYSLMMTATLTAAQSGQYEFQVGVDWGRGGVVAVIDDTNGVVVDEVVRTDDLWWAYNWNNPDVFVSQANLTQGTSYTLAWIGFEGCCAGSSTTRFSFEGSPFVLPPAVLPAALGDGGIAPNPRNVRAGLTACTGRSPVDPVFQLELQRAPVVQRRVTPFGTPASAGRLVVPTW